MGFNPSDEWKLGGLIIKVNYIVWYSNGSIEKWLNMQSEENHFSGSFDRNAANAVHLLAVDPPPPTPTRSFTIPPFDLTEPSVSFDGLGSLAVSVS
jgi:hypothetical protein